MAGERVRELCDKLYHPRNAHCRKAMPKWYNDSLNWALSYVDNETPLHELRMRYILNHLCPSLVHLLPKPHFSYYVTEVYNIKSVMYEFENTQCRVIGCNGEVISHGVEHTVDEWEYLLCAIFPLVGGETKVSVEDYFGSVGISFPLKARLSAVLSEYTEQYVNLPLSELGNFS